LTTPLLGYRQSRGRSDSVKLGQGLNRKPQTVSTYIKDSPKLNKYIQDKVIVVTGAGSGFGRLISLKAAVLGARLVCADVNAETLEATVSEILASSGQAIGRKTDVTSADEMADLAQAAVDRFGHIDVMINNAGVMPLAFFQIMSRHPGFGIDASISILRAC